MMNFFLLYLAGGMLSTMIALQIGWFESAVNQTVEHFNQNGVDSSLQAKQIMAVAFVFAVSFLLYPLIWLEAIATFVHALIKGE